MDLVLQDGIPVHQRHHEPLTLTVPLYGLVARVDAFIGFGITLQGEQVGSRQPNKDKIWSTNRMHGLVVKLTGVPNTTGLW